MEHHGSPLAPGFRLDRYELVCPIAQGGMAEVWVARQTGKRGFEKLVAVKTILPKYADDDGFQRMFLDEAHVSSRIAHPNVAQILDVGEQDDITYLVMEYVDGDALSTLHREAQKDGVGIPHGVLLRLMAEVCGGLHAAHDLRMADGQNAGVVHRDVSPHNILVTTRGTAKLIDFGLAKARDRLSAETSAGIVKGKLRYMAPEQIVGPVIDRRADVWAVGATLYHLLSGEPPYEAEADADVVRALMSGRPPRRLGHAVHPNVEAVVLRALAWRPDQRIATAHELQRALEQAAHHAGLETSASDVTSFLAGHVGHRAQERQAAVALGMREAAEREGTVGRVRESIRSAPSGARPAREESQPREPWTAPSAPLPPSSGAANAISKRLSLQPESRRRSGSSVLPAVAVVLAIAGLGLAFGLTHPSTALPATVVSPAPSATATSPRAAATSRVVATSAPAQEAPPAPAGAVAPGSTIGMTVSVTDLPVATASTARPRVAVPRHQPPRAASDTTAGAPAGPAAADAAAEESSDETTEDR